MLSYVGARPLESVRGLLASSQEVFAAVAYIKRTGVGLIEKEVRALRDRGGSLRVLTTFDFGTTDADALQRLTSLGAEVRIHRGVTYHPKVYLSHGAAGQQVLIGSANLTGGALIRNVEAGVLLSPPHADTIYPQALAHLWAIWQRSGPLQPRPAPLLVAEPMPPEPAPEDGFADLWQAIRSLCARQEVVHTASGQPNRLLAWHPARGVLVGTTRSPAGEWVPRWMFEVTVTWLDTHGQLRLNTSPTSGVPDCTRYLRVHRSSAVFAILGALPRYRLLRRPATLVG